MCVCANHALGGHGEKAVDRMGRGRKPKTRPPHPKVRKPQWLRTAEATPLATPGPSRKPRRASWLSGPRLRWEPRNLSSWPGSAIDFLGHTFLSLSFLLCKIARPWLSTSQAWSEIVQIIYAEGCTTVRFRNITVGPSTHARTHTHTHTDTHTHTPRSADKEQK